ncbi:CBN-AHR-1 protein [Aphelenchoides avenae]|nr:CBN-AHR-1 protein [Aphelenchus avenae]
MALRALGGFVVILSEGGEIYYVTENIDMYLGFLQSDILHQSIFEMIHSEDREEIRRNLASLRQKQETPVHNVPCMERVMQARFRCLLDNTCGFVRVELRGKFIQIHSAIPHSYLPPSAEQGRWGFVAACTPFVPPVQIDPTVEDPILKTKHSLDLSILCLDNRLRQLLELEDVKSGGLSFYSFVHPEDVKCVAEAHASVTKNTSAGLMIYRLVSKRSGAVYYLQSSLRVFFKNGKAESIGGTHRTLSEVDGVALLDKRLSMKFKNLTFDDTLLQSPRNISSVANLTPVAMAADHVTSAAHIGGSKLASKDAKRSPQPSKSKKTTEARQQATTSNVAAGPLAANLNDIANLSMVFPHHVQAADEIAWHFPQSDIKRLSYPQPDVAHAVNSMGFDYGSQAAPSWMPSSSNGYQPPPVPASALYPDSMSTYGVSANAFYPDQTAFKS